MFTHSFQQLLGQCTEVKCIKDCRDTTICKTKKKMPLYYDVIKFYKIFDKCSQRTVITYLTKLKKMQTKTRHGTARGILDLETK